MGLLDKLLNKGAEILGDVVSDTIADIMGGDNQDTERRTETLWNSKEKGFEEKLQMVLQNAGNYEMRKNILPSELEAEFGQELYVRGAGSREPNAITYAIYSNGCRVLLIRLWKTYQAYNRSANRQIKTFCDQNGVKMLDFFDYLPNEEGYMDQRIRENII